MPNTAPANAAKIAKANARNTALARQAIALAASSNWPSSPPPDWWLQVAHAIIDNPGADWNRIATLTGKTRWQVAAGFRRLIVAAGLR